jgi:hypothetical protein
VNHGICFTNSNHRIFMPEDLLDDEFCKPVILKLGKREYRLAFTMAAVLAMKQKTGRNLFTNEGWANFSLRDDPEAILAFFWSALQTYQPELTFERTSRLANIGNMKLISDKCMEALSVYLPAPEPDSGEQPPTTEPQSIGRGIGQ